MTENLERFSWCVASCFLFLGIPEPALRRIFRSGGE